MAWSHQDNDLSIIMELFSFFWTLLRGDGRFLKAYPTLFLSKVGDQSHGHAEASGERRSF